MRICLNEGMAKILLAHIRTTVKNLCSPKKDKFYSVDLLLEWKDGRSVYRLDFLQN